MAKPHRCHASPTTKSAWSADEARVFLDATGDDPIHPLYVTALSTGMRRGELAGLRWEDVDLQAGTIAVSERASSSAERVEGEPKTRTSRRTIDITPGTVAVLRAWRFVRDPVPFASSPAPRNVLQCVGRGGQAHGASAHPVPRRPPHRCIADASSRGARQRRIPKAGPRLTDGDAHGLLTRLAGSGTGRGGQARRGAGDANPDGFEEVRQTPGRSRPQPPDVSSGVPQVRTVTLLNGGVRVPGGPRGLQHRCGGASSQAGSIPVRLRQRAWAASACERSAHGNAGSG